MNKISTRFAAVLTAVGALILAGTAAAPAIASPLPTHTAAEVSGLRTFFSDYGVSSATQAKLMKRYAAGERLDSQSGKQPTRVTRQRTSKWDSTIDHFADGSIVVTSLEVPRVIDHRKGARSNIVKPMDSSGSGTISGCVSNVYTDYVHVTGCTVSENAGNFKMSFVVSYYHGRTGYDYLDSHGSSPKASCNTIYSCQTPTNSNYVKTATSSKPALTTYTEDVNVGGLCSFNWFLTFSVKDGSRSADWYAPSHC